MKIILKIVLILVASFIVGLVMWYYYNSHGANDCLHTYLSEETSGYMYDFNGAYHIDKENLGDMYMVWLVDWCNIKPIRDWYRTIVMVNSAYCYVGKMLQNKNRKH